MKRKIVLLAGIVLVVLISAFYIFKKPSFHKQMEKQMKDLNSYELSGVMEIRKGEDKKKYTLDVGYKKTEKEDYFRVSIHDQQLNQTQVILRNQEGVFVVTPTLNQIFKFEGEWPLNSLKPYLIQSMYEIVKSDSSKIEEKDNAYYVFGPVHYPNNSNYKEQEMCFDENAKIKTIKIYDNDKTQQLSIEFNKVNYNVTLKEDYFDLPKEKSEVIAPLMSEEQLPFYPMNIFDAKLTDVKIVETTTGNKHILQYEGDKSFTLIQSIKKPSENLETVIMAGTLVDNIDGFGFYDGNHMQMIHQGIEYTLYSSDLSLEEMSEVLNSMQVVVMK